MRATNWGSAVSFDGTGNVALSASIDANTVGITEINVTDGTNGQVLTTDGAGNLSFTTASGGTATTINNNANNRVITGSDTADTLEAEANFVFDGTNAGIGTTSPSNLLTVDVNSASSGTDSVSVRNRGVSSANHTAGLRFQFNSAVPSAIRSRLTNLTNGAGTLSLFTSPDGSAANLTERMTINSAGLVSVAGALSLGGETAAANQLDDYEEGTWTPELRISNSTTGIVHNIQAGKYVKIGRLVYIHCHCSLTDKSDRGGSVNIYGIPFNTNFATASAGIPLTSRSDLQRSMSRSTMDVNWSSSLWIK